jgi:hypothetical protein
VSGRERDRAPHSDYHQVACLLSADCSPTRQSFSRVGPSPRTKALVKWIRNDQWLLIICLMLTKCLEPKSKKANMDQEDLGSRSRRGKVS